MPKNNNRKINSLLVIYLNLLTFSIFNSSILNAQANVTGIISNYGILCNPVNCENDGPSTATYYFEAPHDGMLAITGYANPGVINCCGIDYQMSCVGSFRKLLAPGSIHTFSAENTTGYLDCIAAGDMIELNFNGSYGTYGYNAVVIPEPGQIDAEPNDQLNQAIEIFDGNQYTGHLRFGIYQYDNYDSYMFVALQDGTLSLDITTSENFGIRTFRNDGVFVGSTVANTNPFTYYKYCLAQGDTIYPRFGTAMTCLNYNFNVNFSPASFGYDTEPNNDKASAIETVDIYGSVGHGSISPILPDASDYFKLPYLSVGDELEFTIVAIGGPMLFRIRSEQFSGFIYDLGTVTDDIMTNSFQPINFDDNFYLEVFSSTGNCGDYNVTLAGCVDELILTGTESGMVNIKSNNLIRSTQTIESSANVEFAANNLIELEPSFQIQIGAVFEALIAGCSL